MERRLDAAVFQKSLSNWFGNEESTMRLTMKSKSGTVPDAVKQHAQKKLKKLERFFHTVQSIEMEQTVERGQHVVELSLVGDGVLLRSEERCNDLYAAVDNVVDK